jgi:hypothetical protein
MLRGLSARSTALSASIVANRTPVNAQLKADRAKSRCETRRFATAPAYAMLTGSLSSANVTNLTIGFVSNRHLVSGPPSMLRLTVTVWLRPASPFRRVLRDLARLPTFLLEGASVCPSLLAPVTFNRVNDPQTLRIGGDCVDSIDLTLKRVLRIPNECGLILLL